jgi:arsenate reductase (thioredoxin)
MNGDPVIIFVCEHGAAKSIVAAAYFNQLARELNLKLHAIARGSNPDREFSPSAMEGLRRDGMDVPEGAPIELTREDVVTARQIISFCELPEHYNIAQYEKWDDIPPVSENYAIARDRIVAKLRMIVRAMK